LVISYQPLLVSMVGVLDVLCQPVLGPVDLLTVNRHLQILQDDPELVVLHLVVNTVVAWDSTEPLLLIIKVQPHVLLESIKVGSTVWVLGHFKDISKEDIVLLIQSFVISGKACIPNIWLRNIMLKMSPVTKVSVLNVLDKPILSPLQQGNINWGSHLE